MESISGTYWITDLNNNRTIYVSPSFETISGRKSQELFNDQSTFIRSVHPEDKKFLIKMYENIPRTNKLKFIYRILRPSGEIRWISAKSTIITGDAGHKMEYGYAEDITEQILAEEEKQKALERYDILARATHDSIWDWDIEHNTILYNNGIETMFGYPQNEVRNGVEWWNKNIHPDDRQAINTQLQQAFKKMFTTIQMEYRYQCFDNTYKYILDRCYIIYNAANNPTRIIGAMQDVTYQKEEEYRLGKVMIDAQERERQQIGMELHDNVKQILSASLLYSGMAADNLDNHEKAIELIKVCNSLINDSITELRRLSHQLAPASFANVSLTQVVCSLIQNMNPDKKWTVQLNLDELKSTAVPDDIKVNIYRILQEQLNNIVKYANASEVSITTRLTDDHIVLHIADNGSGFDPSKVKMGIGLENIRRRASFFSGDLIVDSAPGKGCQLIVKLPLVINHVH